VKNQSSDVCKGGVSRAIFVLAILPVLCGIGCNSVSPKLQGQYTRVGLSQDIQAVFEEECQSIPKIMSEHKIPGLSIALVDRDGILWTAGFGYTDYDRKTPVTPETIFAIMSITKTVTTTAVMCAIQDGLVELDTPIIKYIPDFTVNSRFEENPQDKITLRHLVTHSSGLTFDAPIGNNRDSRFSCFEEHVKSISDTWLRHRIGERYSYSNNGLDLAAYILQVRSGRPFGNYLKEKLFEPLGMPDSSVDYEFIRRHPNRAIGHWPHTKKVPLKIPFLGSGGMYTNAKDLSRFMQFFLNQGEVKDHRVLDEGLIRTMYTPSDANGLGIGGIRRDNDGNFRLNSSGRGFGFFSHMSWLPEYGIGCVVMGNSNCAQPFSDIFLKLINKKLVEKSETFDIPSRESIRSDVDKSPACYSLDPNTFTPFKPAWSKYIGTYKYIMGGWKLETYARIALALGLTSKYTNVKVYEKDGYLYVDSGIYHRDFDGGRLDEYLPGLFFTPSGECLDLRGPMLTWQNYRIKKIR